MLIGELSRRTGVSARLLRYYEEQGLLGTRREANGYRTSSDDAVVTVRQIRALLAAGLNTDVIRDVLPCANGGQPELDLCPRLVRTLTDELAAMDDRIDSLRQTRGTLAAYLPGS
ncbi:MerR family transcriptional regulator [Saccharothrix sp. ALI-22-I]|uniref:MerR family transcriptional regulator n=1 Tax=Saccharothrix sp. ALI-22-I TaxID=1933778 RepID=UPI00097C998C|nr:MerR family transcriptional regulator [Saccharothrix sp. ALI-22-I]ONI85757.1 MerR family transcriptional regulator [Saccharothrix sp. ALI-22-I]